MKKLIALFAILVAMTSFSFATTPGVTGSATATVNVWNPMTVTITVGSFNPNILTGGSVTIPFTLTVTADANNWSASVNTISATGGSVDYSAFATGSGNGNATENLSVTYTNGGTAGTYTVTATYTAQYDNL